jgi:ABC-type multidrug transport system fused ATPase/permease subunit
MEQSIILSYNTLLETTFEYLKHIPITKWMILMTILNDMILTLIQSDILVRISNGNFSLLSVYLILHMVNPLCNYLLISPLTVTIVNNIRRKFVSDNYYRYNNLSFDSKVIKNYSSFEQVLTPAENSIRMMVDWGFPNVVSLVSCIMGLIWTFYQKNMLTLLFGVTIFFVPCYHFMIKSFQESYTNIHKSLRKARHRIMAKLQLDGISYQYKEYTPEYMIKSTNKVIDNDLEIESSWNRVSGTTTMTIEVTCVGIIWFCSNNVQDFMLFVIVLKQLSNAVQQANTFFTNYNRMKNDFDNYNEFWDGTSELGEPVKLDIKAQPHIEILKVSINRGDYNIGLCPDFGKFTIRPGQKILIDGPSGHGKSSFVKALFGLVTESQIELSFGQGKNFYHQVSDYFQEIKGVMPISKVSIQDIFKGESNFDTIEKYLQLAWSSDEYQRIYNQLSETKKMEEDSCFINVRHPFENEIGNKLSGGQTSRMILWQRGYDANINNKQIIVLDEPCPDVDFDTYIETITKFFNRYQDKLIIMIGHLCDCKRKALNADDLFDTELWIEKGEIKRRK